MTTIETLVNTAPDPSFGRVLDNFPTHPSGGQWRWVVEIADPMAGSDIEWFDVSQFYLSDHLERGADEYMGKYRGTVVDVQLQITPEQADDLGVYPDILAPWGQDTTDLFGENVPLGAGLIMRAGLILVNDGDIVDEGVGTGWNPTWTGTVETWGDSTLARGQIRIHTVTVIDTLSSLVGVPVPAFIGDNDWEVRIGGDEVTDGILQLADWRYGFDLFGEAGLTTMPARAEQTDALVELDNVCDPTGLVFRTTRYGRLLVHPAPWDTTHSGTTYPNPVIDWSADGIVFASPPATGEIDYITDDSFPSFGVQDTSKGVINSFAVTMPSHTPYPVDDPTSIDLYGVKHRAFTWLIDNTTAVDDLLARRANSTKQALPLMTAHDQDGFWPLMGMVDHLDPVTITHTTYESGVDLTASGTVRRIVEDRVVLHETGLAWVSTIQADITSTDVAVSLLPVENLSHDGFSGGFGNTARIALFSWTNPTQVIDPTETQIRIVGWSSIWVDWPYPMTSYQSPVLAPATPYEMQVRLVRKVNGVITNFSPVRSVSFVTPDVPGAVITPGDDPTDTNVDLPDPGECDLEWHIEENDGDTVTTFMSGDLDDLVLGDDGLYHLPSPIDNGDFDPAKLYRVCYREDCGDGFGDWICGPWEDPPDDWSDPCPTPPALGGAPYDDADLLVYVPVLCPTEEP